MPYFVYILYSSSTDKFYTGSAEDVDTRLAQHNSGRNKSTKSGAPWTLKHIEFFRNRSEATNRELQIKKKKSRKYIEWLINSSG